MDTPSSGPEDLSSSLPSYLSFEKHTKDIVSLNMTAASLIWQTSIVAAEGDDLQLRSLIQTVFTILIGALVKADVKDNVVTAQTAHAKVESFNKDELERWKAVVQNCVEKNDWVDLIRTCVSDYQTVGLRSIVTTAALIIPTRPNAASTRDAHSK